MSTQCSAQSAPRRLWIAAAVLLVTISGCDDARAGNQLVRAVSSSGEGGAPVLIDSALALFRRDLSPVAELEDASPSIPALVERFATAVATRDTASIRKMVMSRREFAYLYYPTSAFTREPMKQEPGLVWFLQVQASQKGVTRLFDRLGASTTRIARNSCKPPSRVEGANTLWDDCTQLLVDGRDTTITRLFGGIYERRGRFKIFSYSNDL